MSRTPEVLELHGSCSRAIAAYFLVLIYNSSRHVQVSRHINDFSPLV